MPRAKASHGLRRISQGEPRAPLPLRNSEMGITAAPGCRVRTPSSNTFPDVSSEGAGNCARGGRAPPNRPSQTEFRKRAVQVRNGECGVRSAPRCPCGIRNADLVGRVTPCAPVFDDDHHRIGGGQRTARPTGFDPKPRFSPKSARLTHPALILAETPQNRQFLPLLT